MLEQFLKKSSAEQSTKKKMDQELNQLTRFQHSGNFDSKMPPRSAAADTAETFSKDISWYTLQYKTHMIQQAILS